MSSATLLVTLVRPCTHSFHSAVCLRSFSIDPESCQLSREGLRVLVDEESESERRARLISLESLQTDVSLCSVVIQCVVSRGISNSSD